MHLACALLLAVAPATTTFNSGTASGSTYAFKEASVTKATIEAGGFYCPAAVATASLPASCKDGSIVWDSTALTIKYCASNTWIAPGGGSGAPTNAEYVTYSANATLSNERVLTSGTNTTVDTATAGQVKVNLSGTIAATNLPAPTASAKGGVYGTGASLTCSGGTPYASGFSAAGALQCVADATVEVDPTVPAALSCADGDIMRVNYDTWACSSTAYTLPVAGNSTLGGVKGSGSATTCTAGQYMTGWSNSTGAMSCEMPSALLNPYAPSTYETPAQVGAGPAWTVSGLKDNTGGLDDGYWNNVLNIGYGSDLVNQHQLSVTQNGNLYVRSALRTASWGAWTKFAKTTDNVATATALAANPTDCGAGTKATAIAANGNLTCSSVDLSTDTAATALPATKGGTGQTTTTQGGVLYGGATNSAAWSAAGTSGQVLTSAGTGAPTWTNSSQSSVLTADYTTTTSKVNTGLSWSLPAGKKQAFWCWLEVQDQAAAVGISLQLASTQTLTRVFFRSLIYKTSTTAQTTEVATALSTTIPAAVCAASCVTSSKGWEIAGSLEGHATNAATITVQASSSTAGAKVKTGSYCWAYNN